MTATCNQGRLIVFEGNDAAGKTTIANLFLQHLQAQSIQCMKMSFPGKGTKTIGDIVYDIHHKNEHYNTIYSDYETPTSTALQAMHVAAHLHLIESHIVPALIDGAVVILDRYWWSTLAYGRSSGAHSDVLETLIDAEKRMWGINRPHLIFVVSQAQPLREGEDAESWHTVNKEYDRLIEESHNAEVIRVHNTGTASEALDIVMGAYERLNALTR